jgi:hypothetical protein
MALYYLKKRGKVKYSIIFMAVHPCIKKNMIQNSLFQTPDDISKTKKS